MQFKTRQLRVTLMLSSWRPKCRQLVSLRFLTVPWFVLFPTSSRNDQSERCRRALVSQSERFGSVLWCLFKVHGLSIFISRIHTCNLVTMTPSVPTLPTSPKFVFDSCCCVHTDLLGVSYTHYWTLQLHHTCKSGWETLKMFPLYYNTLVFLVDLVFTSTLSLSSLVSFSKK